MTEATPAALTELPRDATAAATMRAQLTATPEYMKDWQTNQTKQAELGYLRWVAAGHDPDKWGQPPASSDDIRAQMTDRDLDLENKRIETLGKLIRDFDDVKRGTIARGLATQQQHDEAVRELARMKKDPAFGRRVLAGEADAVDMWSRMNLVAAMRVAPPDYKW